MSEGQFPVIYGKGGEIGGIEILGSSFRGKYISVDCSGMYFKELYARMIISSNWINI